MWLYGFAKAVVGFAYRLAYRVEVEGLENVPQDGGAIICGNHFNAQDPILIGITAPRPVSFMAKEELFRSRLLGFIVRGLGAFPVKRGTPDRASLKRAQEVLQSGGCFGIFPEGTRSHSGQLQKPEPGTAYIALKAQVPVVPVGISSTYRLFRPIRVRYGPPVELTPYYGVKLTSENLEQASQLILDGISRQLESPAGNP